MTLSSASLNSLISAVLEVSSYSESLAGAAAGGGQEGEAAFAGRGGGGRGSSGEERVSLASALHNSLCRFQSALWHCQVGEEWRSARLGFRGGERNTAKFDSPAINAAYKAYLNRAIVSSMAFRASFLGGLSAAATCFVRLRLGHFISTLLLLCYIYNIIVVILYCFVCLLYIFIIYIFQKKKYLFQFFIFLLFCSFLLPPLQLPPLPFECFGFSSWKNSI